MVIMKEIRLLVESCKQCPFFKEEPYPTEDSFENAVNWFCVKENKKIQGYVEWHEESKIKIPEWCPF